MREREREGTIFKHSMTAYSVAICPKFETDSILCKGSIESRLIQSDEI